MFCLYLHFLFKVTCNLKAQSLRTYSIGVLMKIFLRLLSFSVVMCFVIEGCLRSHHLWSFDQLMYFINFSERQIETNHWWAHSCTIFVHWLRMKISMKLPSYLCEKPWTSSSSLSDLARSNQKWFAKTSVFMAHCYDLSVRYRKLSKY